MPPRTQSEHDTLAVDADSGTLAADASLPRAHPKAITEAVPEQIGRFRVLQRIGMGGMGVVFAGFDLELDRKVAIKLMLLDRGEGSIGRSRMMREAQAMARLSHPNVIQIYEVGTYAGQIFLAMEFVAGQTLDAWQTARRRPWRELLAMYIQAGRGLAAAHAAGIIHRDFKPDNALVGPDGRLRVLDFGLATRGGELLAPPHSETNPADLMISALDRSLTQVGSVMGTPAYMSPEQALGAPVDARSDQFSLCVALWEALYGQRPFAGESLAALSLNLSAGIIVPPPRHSRVPGWLHRAILRGLEVDPGRRWPDLQALLFELSQGPGRNTRRLLAAAALAATIGVGVGVSRPGDPPCEGGPARLQGVWDDDARAAGAAAAKASDLPFANDTWTRTAAALDARAAAWLAGYSDACLAHHLGEQSDALLDLRMRCLELRRDELAEASSLLQGADARTVERGPDIAAALGSIALCADGQALSAAIPPPEDPAVAAQVDAVRRTLTRSRALESAARYQPATQLAQEALAAAVPLAYPPLLAEATARVGRMSNRTGQFALAATQFEDAYYLALAARHDATAGDVATRLIRLYGDRLNNEAEAKRWQRSAEAFVARAGPDSFVAASLHNNLGTVHTKHRRYEAARVEFEKMVAIHERDPETGRNDLANGYSNLGATLEALGRLDEAEAHLNRALAIREQAFGPQHPDTALPLANLANVYARRGDWTRARANQERVLAIFERSLGPQHANTAMTAADLAKCLANLDDPATDERYQYAIELFIAAFGEASPLVAALRREHRTWLDTGVAAKAEAELQ